MSEKKPYTVTITQNNTGEVETYDTNVVIMAADAGDKGTCQVSLVHGASAFEVAATLMALRNSDTQVRKEFPGVNTLLTLYQDQHEE